ncbi:MAG: biopolymer transporter ExbD [Lentisphaerae bacterium]|nr:biopolymer transporter ExbD [Lentisphaerota bacterium]
MRNNQNNFRENLEKGVEINISPLIDVVFLLLIFFVVTTVFVEETGVRIDRPQAVSAQDLEKTSIMIAVTADNRIVYAGRDVSLNNLRGIVAQQISQKDTPVIIIADCDAAAGRLVEVIDECKLAGANQVSLAANKVTK